jgi:hypothetical protein
VKKLVKHKRPNKGVHMKRHEYGESSGHDRRQRQGRGNGKGEARHQASHHQTPRYMTLAEGQQDPEIRELLKQKFVRLTVIVYGPRLSGAGEFESQGEFIPQSQAVQNDPFETFGNLYAGDLLNDLFNPHLFVCTGIKYRSRDEAEDGDDVGKNYLYFVRQGNLGPKQKFMDPRRAPLCYVQSELERMRFFKAQLYPPTKTRWGVKHTLKLFQGTPRNKGPLEKLFWNTTTRQWMLTSAQRPNQQQGQQAPLQAPQSAQTDEKRGDNYATLLISSNPGKLKTGAMIKK